MNVRHDRSWLGWLLTAVMSAGGCNDSAVGVGTNDDAFRNVLAERALVLDARASGIGRIVPDLPFEDLDGQAGHLSDFADEKALVIVVRDVGCPVSKKQGRAFARLEEEFAPRGIGFLFVNMAEHNTAAEMRGEVETFGFAGTYAYDPEATLGVALGARTTTDTFVLDRARTLVYRGAIDDQYGRGTAPLATPRRTFLRDALEATLADAEVVVSATSAPGCLLGLDFDTDDSGNPTGAEPLTWHREISRIVQANCQECHRAGGAAPFPLESHKQMRGRKGMVRFVVAERIMPPWFASDDCGPWKNDRRLTDHDRAQILRWIQAGCVEGDPRDAPVPREWRDGWQIGTPDLTFTFQEPFPVPAEGIVDLQRFYSEVEVPEDIWIERLQLLPSQPELVHHATVMFKAPAGAGGSDALLDRLVPWKRPRQGWKFLIGYLPGKGPRVYREGVARLLPKGSRIRFEMHYTPNGVATSDRSTLGVVLADRAPDFVAESRLIRNTDIFIPAGEKDVEFAVGYTFPKPVLLRSLTPHMHLIGRTFHTDLILPDGERSNLIRIPEWDPDWQFSYVFAEEPLLPAGSRIQVRAWFDNSADNPNNPDPTTDVKEGPQIWDEMLMLAVEWIEPRVAQ